MKISDIDGKILFSDDSLIIRKTLEAAVKAEANLNGANLSGADLSGANLSRANLSGANLSRAKLPTGESWEDYLTEVVTALLQAGGERIGEIIGAWDCHSWGNCPISVAFSCHRIEDVPKLLRPRAEQFIQLFDARLIPCPVLSQ